jgi:hypothetical protein
MKKINPIETKKQTAILSFGKAVKIILIGLLLLIVSMSAFSQNIPDLKTTIDALKTSSNATERATGIHMYKLAYELNPSLYINEAKIVTTSDETPICAFIDTPSLSVLYTNNPSFENIEYLCITLSDLSENQPLDIAKLISFNSLKYIHFIIKKEKSMSFINNLAKNKKSAVQTYYSIEIPK